MSECRNCGSRETKDLGFIGEVAPFFLKRVLNLEYRLAPSARPLKRALRNFEFVSRMFQRIYGKSIMVEMQICADCAFIQTKRPFQEKAIGSLYADYRSDSYNRERIHYEPEYAAVAPHVGICPQEVQTRKLGLRQWLNNKVCPGINFSMLDFGGADGMFLPDLPGSKYVFDISEVAPVDGVSRIHDESDLTSYSYIQLAHILEHVPSPLALTKRAAAHLKSSGYLYIEVPQELSDTAIEALGNGLTNVGLPIHEHINQYCLKSVTALMGAAGLSPIAFQSERVDFGWNRGTIIRALGKKS